MKYENIYNIIILEFKKQRCTSKSDRAKLDYINDLLESLEDMELIKDLKDYTKDQFEELLLNGANNWLHYSFSGCSLCYNYDIAERILTPSQQKRSHSSDWLLTQQACLLRSAFNRIYWAVRQLNKNK